MVKGKTNIQEQKCGNSVAEKHGEICRWPSIWDEEKKQGGVYRVDPGVSCHPSRRTSLLDHSEMVRV